jgi:hypothetical protein
VFCLLARIRAIGMTWRLSQKTAYFSAACGNPDLAKALAEHKSVFFVEKNAASTKIDYFAATGGQLQSIPTGESLASLGQDYTALREVGGNDFGSQGDEI